MISALCAPQCPELWFIVPQNFCLVKDKLVLRPHNQIAFWCGSNTCPRRWMAPAAVNLSHSFDAVMSRRLFLYAAVVDTWQRGPRFDECSSLILNGAIAFGEMRVELWCTLVTWLTWKGNRSTTTNLTKYYFCVTVFYDILQMGLSSCFLECAFIQCQKLAVSQIAHYCLYT